MNQLWILLSLNLFFFIGTCPTNPVKGLSNNQLVQPIPLSCSTTTTSKNNWMKNIPDHTSLAHITIPGTHDSGADYGCPTFAYNAYAKCQDWSITTQLHAGIRYLDIRCRRVSNGFTIHHGQCYQQKNFKQVLHSCQQFLKNNPSETIIMRIKEEHKPDSEKSFNAIFNSYKNSNPNIWYTSTSMPDIKAVRGKIVILDNASLSAGISYSTDTDIQDKYYLNSYNKKWGYILKQLNKSHNKQNDSKKLFLNHLSATGFSSNAIDLIAGFFNGKKTPRNFAKKMIPKLENYLANYQKGRFGVIIMDFPTNNSIDKIIATNAPLKATLFE